MRVRLLSLVASGVLFGASELASQQGGAQPAARQPMGFFITSVGVGSGGNLGGLAGADQHCQTLASQVGAGNRTWRAYLSAAGSGAQPPVNARDRIGTGPWYNATGGLIAWNVSDLHGDFLRDRNSVNKEFALNEKGEQVKGRGDSPNQHDILTGSDPEGRLAFGGAALATCNNWTSGGPEARAVVGHHDRSGGGNSSWNAAHFSAGCSQENLVGTGGAGLFYCFAAT